MDNPLNATSTDTTYQAYETSQGFLNPDGSSRSYLGTNVVGGGTEAEQSAANAPVKQAPVLHGPTQYTSDGKPYQLDAKGNVIYSNPSGGTSTGESTTTGTSIGDQGIIDANNAKLDTAYSEFSATNERINNGSMPLSAGQQAQVTALSAIYEKYINDQKLTNKGAEGLANVRGFQAGAAEYDPNFQTNTINAIASAGATKVLNLQVEEAGKVAELTAAFMNDDKVAIKAAWDSLNSFTKQKNDALQKHIDDVKSEIVKAQNAQLAAAKVIQDTVTTPINNIALEAAKNGLTDPITLAKIKNSKSVEEAIANAGVYLQTGTGVLADYLQYKRDTQAQGLTPKDYSTYKAEQDAATLKKDAAKAYSTAYNTAAGKAAAESAYGVSPDTTNPTTPNSAVAPGITAATGLSLVTFNYLTQGTGALTRMSATQRAQVMKDANDWLNKNGVDYATFQSQYKAYNDVLAKNIARANQTQVMAGEVSGSADSLMSAINEMDWNKVGNIKVANILDLLAGKQVNDPTTMKYSSQIKFMANDLAGYMAAARGATSPELQDQRDAADIIYNGLSKGSVQAFKDSVNANEEKIAGVVKKAVDDTQKQVWTLFGVGDKYQTKITVDPKSEVDNYIKANTGDAETIAKLYEVPGATDKDIYDYLKAQGKIQ